MEVVELKTEVAAISDTQEEGACCAYAQQTESTIIEEKEGTAESAK